MEIGLHLPNSGLLAGKRNLVDLARDAEALGVDTVWVADHLFNPVELGSKSVFPGGQYYNRPEMPYYNSLATLFVIAGATSSLRLGTNVLIPVYRHPVELAKQIGTLCALVGDRFILGVGAGWMHEEFEAVGITPGERFARLDEAVSLIRGAWAQEITEFKGAFYEHVPAGFRPVPGQVPIIVGGRGEGAVRRAVDWGDGWTVAFPEPGPNARGEAEGLVDRLRSACERAGRDLGELELVCSVSLNAPPSHFELMADIGVTMCDVVLAEESDLDLDRFAKFMAEVADPLRSRRPSSDR